MSLKQVLLVFGFCFGVVFTMFGKLPSKNLPDPYANDFVVATLVDTIPLKDRTGDFITDKQTNPFDITTKEIVQKVEYDPVSGHYIIYEKIGNEFYRTPTYMTFEEYLDYKSKEQEKEYFNSLAGIKSDKKSRSGKIDPMDKVELTNSLIDRLFGGTEVNIKPQGTVDLSIGWLYSRRDDPSLPITAQRQSQPDFPTPLIKMNVDGKIGKKLDLGFNYDTQSQFDFDRQIKLAFDSDAFSEDDIIKKIEAGNVSLPLRGNLIQGAQSLFGLKTELQFGRLRVTGLLSQQRSRANNIKVENGASIQEFEIYPDDYDENRHFFISHYNRNTYERALSTLPFINTSHQIAQIEVWISDDRPEYQDNSTMVAAISDLGEPDPNKFTSNPSFFSPNGNTKDETGIPIPRNGANTIYAQILQSPNIVDIDKVNSQLTSFGLKQTRDFEVFRGRRLSSSEYTYHPKLGTLSLNIRLRPNQVLGVAYNYYYTTICDTLFQVGQLSASSVQPGDQTDTTRVEPPKVHFVKLLKSTNQVTKIKNSSGSLVVAPMWDLMMKNVYPLRTTSLNQQDFEFDIFFEDDRRDGTLKKYIPEENLDKLPLLQLFNLDRLNRFGDPQPDGYFDYLPGITVIERSGAVVIPVLEPFGKQLTKEVLEKELNKGLITPEIFVDSAKILKYRFQELYDTSISIARQDLTRNKFRMTGKVKSTSNNGEIPLGPFVPQGSVRVTAGSKTLVEGQDYEIDYSLGRLRIINEAYLAQGTPVNVSFEDNSLFSLQQKNMMGIRAEYQFNKKSSLGATFLRLAERPFTQKVNIGDDPINNKIFGLDYNYNDEVPWVTKMIDKLPFYSTAEKSNINLTAEAAGLIPGHAKAINTGFDDTGIANIDDFEGAITNLNLGGFNANLWSLASTPSNFGQREGLLQNDLTYGANRARLNWYVLDFGTPRTQQDNTDPYARSVGQNELFANRQNQPGQNQLFTFDLSYYPSERGPYNFDNMGGISGYTKGFEIQENKIVLKEPKTRWAGISRYFQNADFEAANYESIEFWMLNPFMERRDSEHDGDEEGEIIFNLGSVSEDIIKDNFLFFENAIPTPRRNVPTTGTAYGRATVSIPLVNGFDLQDGPIQDLGFDGLTDAGEQQKYSTWLQENQLAGLPEVTLDPANDNFKFFNDPDFDDESNLLVKMKEFNGPQGNAPLNNSNQDQFVRGNRYPDNEDLNNNKSLDQTEAYYEYKIKIKNNSGELDTTLLGNYYRQSVIVTSPSGAKEKWYRFQIPINNPTDKIGEISGFRSIQFMRMYMTNFSKPKTFRLAEFQLQRSQWRKQTPQCYTADTPGSSVIFNIDDVGIEENSKKRPFNYILPAGVIRTQSFGTVANLAQDERSMVLKFENLSRTCEVSISKLARVNLSLYKRLQMFVHAESNTNSITPIKDKELAIFVRIGKDFDNGPGRNGEKGANNYYEYELPLIISKPENGFDNSKNIWPDSNYINIPLDSLLELKRLRIRNNIPNSDTVELAINEGRGDKIRMIGNPSLGVVKAFQIGVRNIATGSEVFDGEVWINELRVTGFEESGGVAAQAKMQVQMADLGELNIAGNYSSIGFGALDKRLMERNREETVQYDIATNIDAGKLLPKALKITLPVYAQYQKTYITPQFDPFDLDLTVKEKLNLVDTQAEKDSIRNVSREEITIKTFNVTNVKVQAGDGSKPWSPSNISASYAFTENIKSDPIIKEDKSTNRTVGLDYVYARKSNYIEPFKFIKVKALKILSDFNFSLLPSNFSFTTRVININNSRTFRLPVEPVFVFDDNRLSWERNYVLDWDLTRSLRFNFRANTNSVVDQLRQTGIANTADGRDWVDENGSRVDENGNFYNDVIANDDPNYAQKYRNQNFKRLGRSKNYTHNVSVNYKLPFKSIPILDWIQAGVDYKADYAWDAGALIQIDALGTPLGNTIRNGQNAGVNMTFGFDKLYNKSSYLKSIETGKAPRAARNRQSPNKPKTTSKDGDKTQMEVSPEVTDGSDPAPKKKTDKSDEPKDPSLAERVLLRPLMLIRSIKFNYKEERGTIIPGFMPQSSLLGQSEGFAAPGWDFIAGVQPNLVGPNNWLIRNQGWFNPSLNFNGELSQNKRQTLDVKLLVEPFKDFSVDISFKRNYTENHTEVFRTKASENGEFMQQAKFDVGTFDASYYALNTLFGNSIDLYNSFKSNREIISRRLPNIENPGLHPSDPEYVEGYGPSQNNVNVAAFIAAYTNKSAFDIELDQKKEFSKSNYIPRPNWQLNYNGLSRLNMFKDIFSNITIKHGYSSTIRVSRFETQPNYNSLDPFVELSPNNNYYSQIEIPTVSIQEQFVPVIGISVKTVKDMKIDFEYKTTRNLELGISQLRENKGKEIIIGGGYVIKNFKAFSKKKKSVKKKKKKDGEPEDDSPEPDDKAKRTTVAKGRDLRFNLSYSLRDDLSQVYDLLTGISAQADRGSKTVTLNPTIEYDVNKNLSLRFYFDYSKITPKTSLNFPVTTIRSGLTLRFNIN